MESADYATCFNVPELSKIFYNKIFKKKEYFIITAKLNKIQMLESRNEVLLQHNNAFI